MAEDDTASATSTASSSSGAEESRGTFVPLIFGGAVATALGFFGSQIDSVEAALGLAEDDAGLQQAIDAQAQQIEEQAARIDEQSAEIAALLAQVAEIPEPAPAVDIAPLEDGLSGTQTALEALEDRISELEKRPMTEGLSEDAIAAYEAELETLRGVVGSELEGLQQVVTDQRAEIAALIDEARSAESEADRKAEMALARAALARVITAVDTGEPFADAVAELQGVGGVEVPSDLLALAGDGVPTLAQVQAGYADAARAGLSAARAAAAEAGDTGLGSFLQRQLGARSVTPKEGDDPDSVLSRAEAAVRQGQIGVALDEVAALPEEARDAMSGWLDTAQKRFSATAAAEGLMAALSTN